MKCPQCQTENLDSRKFCRSCGNKLVLSCPHCTFENLPGDEYCGQCGGQLRETKPLLRLDSSHPPSYTPKHLADQILTSRSAVEGERKLVTVLFADVANYTALSEKLDPEEVHQIMDGCFHILMEEIHRLEGTINQFTGDGVMALFGAPLAHEDHAQRACHAALAIQKAMEEYGEKLKRTHDVDFRMRIGLNSGSVVVGSIGDDLRMDYTAVGDTTNLASRMQSLASPGTVLISSPTYRLTKDFFEFSPLGRVSVKGKEEAVEAYKLLRSTAVETRFEAAVARGLTRFVGRAAELEALRRAYDKARAGAGQVVGVVGEAGVGKSRLLIELRNALHPGEATYLEGRCLHYGAAMAYLPILDILRTDFGIKEGDGEAAIKDKLEERILRLDERLQRILTPLHDLLSLKVEDQIYLELEPQQKRMRIFEALRDLLFCESDAKPLVLAVEDLHWIDKTTQDLLDYLIGGLAHTHILLILLYRPEYTHPWSNRSYYNRVGLEQLSAENSAELVQALLVGGEVAPELRELIVRRAGGNPLFVEEFTQTLLENGSIQRRDDWFVLTRKASEIQVPDTIQGVIASRIDRLEEGLKSVMQVASVVGREFAFRVVQTVAAMTEDVKASLRNLQGLEFISEKKLFPELEYIFKHALIQEVAYNSLLLKRRKDIHERIGRAIETLYGERLEEYYELLAYHYGHSDDKEKALEYLDLANQKAIRRNAMEDAKGYFDEAMSLLDGLLETEVNLTRRVSLLVTQFVVFRLLIKFPEYYELLQHYEPAAVRIGNQALLAAFYARKSHCEYSFGYEDQAMESGAKAAQLGEDSGNLKDAGYGFNNIAWACLCRGDYGLALRFVKEALRVLEKQPNPRFCVYVLANASWVAAQQGHWEEAYRRISEMLRIGEEASDDSLISFGASIASYCEISRGDLGRALEHAELAVRKAPTPQDKIWAQTALAWTWCRAGDPGRGVDELLRIAPTHRASQALIFQLVNDVAAGEGQWLAGDLESARQTLGEALQLAERSEFRYFVAWAERLLGEVAAATGHARASAHFEKSIATAGAIGAKNELGLAHAGYGRLQRRQGNIALARQHLTQALEILERLGTLLEPDRVREELAQLPS